MPYLWCLWTISNDLGVKMGVLEAKKLIGDSLTCPTRVLHVPDTMEDSDLKYRTLMIHITRNPKHY